MTDLQKINEAIAEHTRQYEPGEPVILRFFNRQRRQVWHCNSHDLLVFGDYMHTYFQTENEYEIAIECQLRTHPDAAYSYVEVWSPDAPSEFICRRYIRAGQLSPFPFIGFEPDINQDKYARLPQIAARPTLNWKRIIGDQMRGVNINPLKYKL